MEVANQFAVGIQGDSIVILLPPRRPLTKEEALGFAACIVVQATMGNLDEFKPYTDAVMS